MIQIYAFLKNTHMHFIKTYSLNIIYVYDYQLFSNTI